MTKDHETQAFVLRVLWGEFGFNGSWQPNPLLNISPDEQYRQNLATLKPDLLTTKPA